MKSISRDLQRAIRDMVEQSTFSDHILDVWAEAQRLQADSPELTIEDIAAAIEAASISRSGIGVVFTRRHPCSRLEETSQTAITSLAGK